VAVAQNQDINFSRDVIKIPTGDGAAIVFPFEGLEAIHLEFATSFLSSAMMARGDVHCDIFQRQGWCNCHDFFDVRVGIAEGRGIIFKDINGNYNVAGSPINIASRVMGLADEQQIIVSDHAFRNLIDMTEDISLEEKFRLHGKVEIKHGISIEMCQYIGTSEEDFINTNIPHVIKMRDNTDNSKSSSQSLEQQIEYIKLLGLMKELPAGILSSSDDYHNTEEVRGHLQAMVELLRARPS
jgi:hypothetical protein